VVSEKLISKKGIEMKEALLNNLAMCYQKKEKIPESIKYNN
jgi:hypothetical protein